MSTNKVSADFISLNNGVQNFKSLATQGYGVPAIYREGTSTGNTGAVASILTFTPSAPGVFIIYANVNVTAWTTPASFILSVTYTDDNAGAQTETLTVSRGSTGATAAAITAIDRWYSIPIIISSAGLAAITVLTSGTFTGSPVYNTAASIMQIG